VIPAEHPKSTENNTFFQAIPTGSITANTGGLGRAMQVLISSGTLLTNNSLHGHK